jgi:hypothetical protein
MRRSQRGFTLFEVLSATTAVMALAVPATYMLFHSFAWYTEVQSQLKLNREAREVSDILMNGARMTTNGNDGTPNIYGLRMRKTAPVGSLRSNYVLNYPSNNLTATSSSVAGLTVACKAAGNPLPDCTGTETRTVQGWVGADVTLDSATRSIAGRTTEVSVTMVDPFQAQRMKNPAKAVERYRMVIFRNRDENDP